MLLVYAPELCCHAILLCSYVQVEARWWIRNGEDVLHDMNFYSQWKEHLSEPDMLLLQLWLATTPPEHTLVDWMLAYGAKPLLMAAGKLHKVGGLGNNPVTMPCSTC